MLDEIRKIFISSYHINNVMEDDSWKCVSISNKMPQRKDKQIHDKTALLSLNSKLVGMYASCGDMQTCVGLMELNNGREVHSMHNEPNTKNKASTDVVTRYNLILRPKKHYNILSHHHVVDYLDLCSELHFLSSAPTDIRSPASTMIANGKPEHFLSISTAKINHPLKPHNVLLDEYYNARISDFNIMFQDIDEEFQVEVNARLG
ncbi:hypothetical protein G4B88_000328 [Cannabis sativa]|uniref:Uncharacterized protein n=1 Tax=Cannabis sativa TaxID=3483 RepID=A0A7J6DVD2_CANSA|nr:hypothetical protein G4B88_000328 [Cannabis sativa]